MKLSEFELDAMAVIWRLGECSAPNLHEAFKAEKSVTYSTVKTIVDRLEKKGAITRVRNEGRTIFFKAAFQPDTLQSSLLNKLINTVFAGDSRPLFNHLLDRDEISQDDLDYLTDLITKRRGEVRDD